MTSPAPNAIHLGFGALLHPTRRFTFPPEPELFEHSLTSLSAPFFIHSDFISQTAAKNASLLGAVQHSTATWFTPDTTVETACAFYPPLFHF